MIPPSSLSRSRLVTSQPFEKVHPSLEFPTLKCPPLFPSVQGRIPYRSQCEIFITYSPSHLLPCSHLKTLSFGTTPVTSTFICNLFVPYCPSCLRSSSTFVESPFRPLSTELPTRSPCQSRVGGRLCLAPTSLVPDQNSFLPSLPPCLALLGLVVHIFRTLPTLLLYPSLLRTPSNTYLVRLDLSLTNVLASFLSLSPLFPTSGSEMVYTSLRT